MQSARVCCALVAAFESKDPYCRRDASARLSCSASLAQHDSSAKCLEDMSGALLRVALDALDRAAKALGRVPDDPEHIVTGRKGEELAYFHLRKLGYIMVARNYRSPRHRGEIDLIGWDGGVLCVVEVKTRSSRGLAPAEAAVDREKQDELRLVAREYLRGVPAETTVRGDVVSVYVDAEPPEIELFKNAFPLR